VIVQERYLEVDWEQYFQSISDVCPWSLEAYHNDLIKFARYSDTKVFYHDETWNTRKHMAIIYYDVSSDVDDLIWTVDQFDALPNTICFWSHPEHTKGKNKQCTIPIIIQQGRQTLEAIRKQHKYNKQSRRLDS
jgi:hypothetical protein